MNKHIWKIDLVIILVSAFVLMGLVGYARPLVIAPLDEYESLNGEVLFEFEGADVLLIDDNMEFTTPDEYVVSDGLKVRLNSGVYYWKVVGVLGSEVRMLTINSVVDLELVEIPLDTKDQTGQAKFGVVNAGNVRLNVDVYDGEELIERRKLDVDESVGGGDKFVGEME